MKIDKTSRLRIWERFRPKWTLNRFGKKKALLAFEFAIVLSDTAKQLDIEMTLDIVLRAENLISREMGKSSAERFAGNMNVYILAVLEPKDGVK